MYFPEDESIAKFLQHDFSPARSYVPIMKENENPVDSNLELLDPTPSIHDLFVRFDKKFFWNSLGMVEVLWSKKMTTCAGMCHFQGKYGLCKISLSAPLLSLRPRKDLVETLLHEMIHAYLFVTDNYKDRSDHGPEFHKHMYRINNEAGTNITVYHTFHDEVEYHKKHIWRCNGPCKFVKPYFGFVRRAMNRPPGPHDSWWNKHKMLCSGTFIKISEPEEKSKGNSNSGNKMLKNHKNIKDFFIPGDKKRKDKIQTVVNIGKDTKTVQPKGSQILKVKTVINENSLKNNTNSEKNNFGLFNLSEKGVQHLLKKGVISIDEHKINSGKSVQKNSSKKSSNNNNQLKFNKAIGKTEKLKSLNSDNVIETVRNVWSKKNFPKVENSEPDKKKLKFECKFCLKGFPQNEFLEHESTCAKKININSDGENAATASSSKTTGDLKECLICAKKVSQFEIEDHLETCLKCSFVNDKKDEDPEPESESNCNSLPCPCCYKWFKETEMNSHLDECLTIIALKEEFLAS